VGPISRTRATLRIIGDAVVPTGITRLLGAQPTLARTKGEIWAGAKTGKNNTAHTGQWHLKASDREPEDLDGQVQELLGKLTQDLKVWAALAQQFQIDLFCGLFMQSDNEGATLSPDTLAALGNRGIKLSLDIYDDSKPRRFR
jgi:hypothetical protein